MEARFTLPADAYRGMQQLEQYLLGCGLDNRLLHLLKLRASQINGCAYCLDMHWKDLKEAGESDQRMYSLDAWRECPYYSDRERAALAWTEAVTLLTHGHVPDAVYDEVRRHFSAPEIGALTVVVMTINAWNRFAIASRLPPGTYQPPRRTAEVVHP